ncbi:MAG: DegT/DnrJ/EryC1/StrS family aminotransferase [Candidatus Hydrogenedens sp.]|nr:DegT/DnrJ/EryC1/StrS family aminotransferase [Candidatus Hydrogenedens sp.]
MHVPMLNLRAQYEAIRDEIQQAIAEVLETQQFRGGQILSQFEEDIKNFIQCRYAIGVGSGTDALILALKAIGIKSGDEIITTPFSFIATASSIVHAGGTPVFADIEPDTYHLNPKEVENQITERTRAILPVHLYGQCVDMPLFLSLAEKYSLYIIEDSAQSLGASLHNKKAGAWGHVACFSFYPTKNLGAMGEGGLVTTNYEEIANNVMLLRCHGSQKTYEHELIGYNSHLHTLQANVLRVKLRYLEKWNEKRREIARYYTQHLNELPELQLPIERAGSVPVYHQYVIRIPQRDSAQKYLREQGIATAIFYPIPIHRQPCSSTFPSSSNSYPEAEKASKEVLALPIYPELTYEQIDYVIDKIKDFLVHIR